MDWTPHRVPLSRCNNPMLQLLTSLGRAIDRRASRRYETCGGSISLQWWTGGVAHEAAACLLNIGDGGASLMIDDPPPLGQSVRIRLERTGRTDWIDGRVIRRCGLHQIAVEFGGVCPKSFFAPTTRGDQAPPLPNP
jgi:hypothetical protein